MCTIQVNNDSSTSHDEVESSVRELRKDVTAIKSAQTESQEK
jgi:hypothetical protein